MRRVVAEGEVTRVERCDCGSCHLTVGPVTLALHPTALAELHRTLGRALGALAAEPAPPPNGPGPS